MVRLRLPSLRKVVLGVAVYAVLWLVTATLGARMVETKWVRTHETITRFETTTPCPLVVLVHWSAEDYMTAMAIESTYLWLVGSACLREVVVARACKYF
jgi:hypothetical protein